MCGSNVCLTDLIVQCASACIYRTAFYRSFLHMQISKYVLQIFMCTRICRYRTTFYRSFCVLVYTDIELRFTDLSAAFYRSFCVCADIKFYKSFCIFADIELRLIDIIRRMRRYCNTFNKSSCACAGVELLLTDLPAQVQI
jgi:hypothetical protein